LCLCACGGGGPLVYSNLRISLQIFMKFHMNIIPLTLLVSCNQQELVHLAEGHEQMYGNRFREKYSILLGVLFMPCEKCRWSCTDVLQLLL